MEQTNNKNGKLMIGAILLALLLIILVGVTYAFFNYTRTGSANTIRTGRIAFNTTQGNAINLTNMFPIDVTNGIPNDATKVGSVTINVTGDTTYADGLEYLVTATNVQNSVGNKSVPISIDVSVSNNSNNDPVTTLGTADSDYFTNRGASANTSIYKVLAGDVIENNDQLVVGYIKSGAIGVDGNIVIKAYLDKAKVAISDTYPEGTIRTVKGAGYSSSDCETALTGVANASTYCASASSLQDAIDNSDLTAAQIALLVNAGIVEEYNDGTTSEWVGDRVVFTTEEWNSLQTNGVSFQIKVESNEGIWVEEPPKSAYDTVTENVLTPTTPINFANISSPSNGEGLYILPGTENDTNPIYYYRGAVTNNNVIFGDYCWQIVRTTDTGGIKMIYNGAVTGNGETCENSAHADRIVSSAAFNTSQNSVSDVGYMSNIRYSHGNSSASSKSIYGKDVEWDGSKYLVIEDTEHIASTNKTKDDNHHYTCGTETGGVGDSECNSVRYYYYSSYYITLTNGDMVEDALYKMIGNGSNETKQKNSSYVLNQNNSTIKGVIDTWFETNLTNIVDDTRTNYRLYLEDTIYCNDRSFKTIVGNTQHPTYLESGWNKSGGLNKNLSFVSLNRVFNNWYGTTNVPTTACQNESNRFTVQVGDGNGALTYPVGLLTVDEIVMAGASGNSSTANDTYYLYTGGNYWSLSPYGIIDIFGTPFPTEVLVNSMGGLSTTNVAISYGIRPVVSLKLGTKFESGGDGTPTNPYVVKYN